MEVDVNLTMADATKLMEEKITRLRHEQGMSERAAQEAVSQRDRALHDVTTLRGEHTTLLGEIDVLKQTSQRIKSELAEHRKNVESSLAKTEANANVTIDHATKATEALKAQEQTVRQLKAQVVGLKQTLRDEAQAAQDAIAHAVSKTLAALDAIPE